MYLEKGRTIVGQYYAGLFVHCHIKAVHQRTRPQRHYRTGRITLRIAATSILFPKFVFKYETWLRGLRFT